jgi:hypothetical protein
MILGLTNFLGVGDRVSTNDSDRHLQELENI